MQFIKSIGLFAATAAILSCGIQSTALAEGAPQGTPPGGIGAAMDDSMITAKIKAAYVHDPVVGVLGIQVNTVHGVVQLSGVANSETEKDMAAAIAKSVEGVREVRNDIRVK